MKKTQSTAIYGIFAAVIVILQLLSYTPLLKIGTFSLSLVLIPIVFGAYLYGPKAGALFGGVFGAVVVFACAIGLDLGGAILFTGNWFLTTVVCILKGVAAGYSAGLICKILKNANKYLTIMLAAAVAPIVNSGLFSLAMLTVFKDTLYQWAGDTPVLSYVLLSLIGINFIIELAINLIFAPSLVRIKKALKR